MKQPDYQPLQAPSDLSPQGINATAPYGYQAFGNIPSVNATYWNAAQANPFQQQQYLDYYNSLVTKGLQPFFNQQLLQSSQNLAARGITDSSAANYEQNTLRGQQAGQVAQQEAPMVSQAFGYTQQDIMANQQAQNMANAANAAAANQATNTNAAYYNDAVRGNMDAYNAYVQSLFGAGTGEQNTLLGAYLNTFGPNPGVGNLYGSGIQGVNSVYGDIYSAGLQGQGAAMGGIGSGLGSYFGMMGLGSAMGGGAGAGVASYAPFYG